MCCCDSHIQPIHSGAGLVCLLLNIFFPPFGTMVYACKAVHAGEAWKVFIIQFILLFIPFVNIGAYIWIICHGVAIYKKSSDHHFVETMGHYEKMDHHNQMPVVVNVHGGVPPMMQQPPVMMQMGPGNPYPAGQMMMPPPQPVYTGFVAPDVHFPQPHHVPPHH